LYNKITLVLIITFFSTSAFAKFTMFERMNDLFYDEPYFELEYNYYDVESKTGFTDNENDLKFSQFDEQNTSEKTLHEISISASKLWGLSLLANIMSDKISKMDDWNNGYSIHRYNFGMLYDTFEIQGENKFYKIGFAYEYLNLHFSNPDAEYSVIVNSTGTDYTGKQSFDFIAHDALLYCVIGWPKWGDLSNAYLTVRGGPSWLDTKQETMSVIYDSDPGNMMVLPTYSLITTNSRMKNRGFTAGLGAHYITHNILSIFMDTSLSFWNDIAEGQYYDHSLNIMRYKIQAGLGLHFGKNLRIMASVVIDNFECDRDLSNYNYNVAKVTTRYAGFQYGLTLFI